MAKNPSQIYVRVAVDQCAHRDESGYACGKSKNAHSTALSTIFHMFTSAPAQFVYPTDDERRQIYEQLKEEFDV